MKTETAVILLIAAATFVGGIAIGAAGHKTLTEQPAMAQDTITAGPGAHAAASMTAIPVPVVTHRNWNAYVATFCPTAGLKTKANGEAVTPDEILQCFNVASQNTKEAQKDPVTIGTPKAPIGKTDTMDTQTREWYRLMTEKGLYPMVTMVPKERLCTGSPHWDLSPEAPLTCRKQYQGKPK